MILPVDLCAICGGMIPFFTADADESAAALSEFDTLADGRPAHGICLDKEPRELIATMLQVEMFGAKSEKGRGDERR